ncbi:MAG: proton-conducting transporter membrane subunit [Sinobacteraceae bacterium]|nr:hydrogenase 4 subunit B [Nevskia sp.]MDI3259039.1 proton-conducting transporter membrane subunit [Nevskiaceae bacterium]
MAAEALGLALLLWLAGGLLAISSAGGAARAPLVLGCAAGIVGCLAGLADEGLSLTIGSWTLAYSNSALWLFGFGLLPAGLAAALGSPVREGHAGWCFGVATSLLGAAGVFGAQDGVALLIAWELMSLGGAALLLSEKRASDSGRPVLFMLALLEVGAVALLLAVLLLDRAGGGMGAAALSGGAQALSGGACAFVGALFVIAFGAKLGLLPFYEWFPSAYASGSGATGALLSGVVLNAAYFALTRALIEWLPGSGGWLFTLGVGVVIVGVCSAILTALYAFQQDDWRGLLSFSSAENASIAVATLGAALLFRADGHDDLAALAWCVALLHLAGHALAKGTLFLAADGVAAAGGDYRIAQGGWLKRGGLLFGVGALCAAMSLAALPPQAGFTSEWFVFQTLFQGFHLGHLGGRLTLALAGAGLALTAAIAFATFVKLFGLGLLGAPDAPRTPQPIGAGRALCVFALGFAVLALAIGLPWWLLVLDAQSASLFGGHYAAQLRSDWLLVPLTAKFAFISPSKLVIALPLLALLPLLLLLNARRHAVRRVPIWYGGLRQNPRRSSTTALTFSNALRTFYSFIYRPTADTAREHGAHVYFVKKLQFDAEVAPVFGPLLFAPLERLVWKLAGRLRALQSGDLNFYLALIGALLVLILAATLR